jgi:predicted RNase H-like HicB family nuclease
VLKLEFDREDDGRWIAEAPEVPGVLAYGATQDEAKGHAMALALRVIADKIEHNEPVPQAAREFFEAP